jgi:hypothetical protein
MLLRTHPNVDLQQVNLEAGYTAKRAAGDSRFLHRGISPMKSSTVTHTSFSSRASSSFCRFSSILCDADLHQ